MAVACVQISWYCGDFIVWANTSLSCSRKLWWPRRTNCTRYLLTSNCQQLCCLPCAAVSMPSAALKINLRWLCARLIKQPLAVVCLPRMWIITASGCYVLTVHVCKYKMRVACMCRCCLVVFGEHCMQPGHTQSHGF